MKKSPKMWWKIVGLELLIIFFFSVNGAYASITNQTNAFLMYLGLVPFAIGIAIYLWRSKGNPYFKDIGRSFKQDRLFLWAPLILLLGILVIGNGGIRETSFSEVLLVFVTQLLIVAFIEEIVFRGFMIHILLSKGFKLAVLVSSIFFALTHSLQLLGGQSLEETIFQIAYAFLIGMVLALLVIQTKSILFAIIFHGLNNFLLIISENNGPSIYNYAIIVGLIVYATVLWRKAERKAQHFVSPVSTNT
ncbi:CPBP family intramembrane glutamic endopeptidase [Paenisporosarcina cavernae]|uniref:CPBP family intramembrane metalloprotease n=1 Tax=Paenisporosarcina cavernae TaxID=2320858 RepID=A0A385YXX5_9BACL|nr:CPBP family intramembrane glutamic endopeptidase [Paenisporosarcina cavernae]AYC30458.1 CPBP family intramembrane metalloprotease [Paenisporosarcina cavernae]